MKSIGSSAFYGCGNLTSKLYIPNTITEIGESAFQRCSNLQSVEFEEGSTVKLVKNVFAYCPGLQYIRMASTMNEFTDSTFAESVNIESVIWTGKAIIKDFPADFASLKCNIFIMEGYNKNLLKSLYLNVTNLGKFSINTLLSMSNIMDILGKEDVEVDIKVYTYNSMGEEYLESGQWCYIDDEIFYY